MVTLPKMVNSLKQAASTFPDKRTGKNLRYDFMDVAMGAFSIFFTQSPSFLSHQRLMQKSQGVNNATSLFGVIHIPTDNHIRDLLDEVEAEKVFPVFDFCFDELLKAGYLNQFRQENGDFLLALDGTEYFSSEKVHCSSCTKKEHTRGKITYSQSMITPVIVAPERNQIIPLSPEYITPQDGDTKQDCESKAAKRWIKGKGVKLQAKLRGVDPDLRVTILGDDLYAHQPICEQLLDQGFNFILVCKEQSHPLVYEYLQGITEEMIVEARDKGQKQIVSYRYASNIPIKDQKGAKDDVLKVNWCEITMSAINGGRLYHNAFITNLEISRDNVAEITREGRARWKVENENNNTLKTKGYHLEHNFGHGKKQLSKLLTAFTLLSFLFHTVMELSDGLYQSLRERIPTREIFFEHIKALTVYLYFKSWTHLFTFMIEGLKRRHLAPDYGVG